MKASLGTPVPFWSRGPSGRRPALELIGLEFAELAGNQVTAERVKIDT
jgi:hypothetical protein